MKKLGLLFFAGMSVFAVDMASAETMVTPVVDVSPEYPDAALRREAAGYVVVRFDVSEDGKAQNISIIEASPERLFNNSVRTALLRSTFEVEGDKGATNIQRTYRFSPPTVNNQVVAN